MAEKEVCKICGKEFKKVTMMHVSTHKDLYPEITMEQYNLMHEYDALNEFDTEDLDVEPTGNTKVTQKEIDDRIWGNSGNRKKDANRPLQDFLNEFGMDEEEARGVLSKFVKGDRIDPKIQARNFKRIGTAGAEELKDRNRVETDNLHIAEELQVNHGFTCTEVRGKKGNTPKIWVLTKT